MDVTRPAVIATLRAAGCVYAEDEAALLLAEPVTPVELMTMLARRAAGIPLEHVLGWAAFCGSRVKVVPGVFVPRRRTEFLVQQALRFLAPGAIVVDLCSGSGAVGYALGVAAPTARVHSVDCDPVAADCSARNLATIGATAHRGDLYGPLPRDLRGRVDVVVANAPYVPTGEIRLLPAEARDFEPRAALDGGADGLAIARRIAAGATDWLGAGGHVLIETSDRQAAGLAAIMAEHGLAADTAHSDDLDATVVIASVSGRRPPWQD